MKVETNPSRPEGAQKPRKKIHRLSLKGSLKLSGKFLRRNKDSLGNNSLDATDHLTGALPSPSLSPKCDDIVASSARPRQVAFTAGTTSPRPKSAHGISFDIDTESSAAVASQRPGMIRAMSRKISCTFTDRRAMMSKKMSWYASASGRVLPPEKVVMARQVSSALFLAVITFSTIRGLNNFSLAASVFWILYEVYILFDHIPFLFTRGLYDSPEFNFKYVPLILFWGMEVCASVVGCFSAVGAPYVLLYNVAPHLSFIYANNVKKAACSYAFIPDSTGHKKWYIFLQVFVDNSIHVILLWYHLSHLQHISQAAKWGSSPFVGWLGLLAFTGILTTIVHKRHMRLAYFVEDFSRTVLTAFRFLNCRILSLAIHALLVGIQAHIACGMMKSCECLK